MASDNDKWFYLIAGIIGGALIGVILQKFILQLGAPQQTTLYGASYSYDKESGRLTSYIPLPIPITPIVAPAPTPAPTPTPTTTQSSSSLLSSFVSSEIPTPMRI